MNDILIIISLILLNGIFAMSEIAIISARRNRLEKRSEEGNKGATTALRLAADPDIFLSTIQIGITLIGILTGIYSGDTLGAQLGNIFISWGMNASIAIPIATTFIVVIVTYLTLILGELVPKRIGMATADRVAAVVARPIYWLSVFTKPLVWFLAKSTSFLVAILGIKKDENKITEEEIKSYIQEGTDTGEVKKVEQDIMERVFLMGDLKVRAIMTHRSDVVCIDINSTKEDIRHILSEDLHDNYPVISGSFDDIRGVITLKDLILRLDDDNFSLAEIIHPIYAIHKEMSIYDCLERLKADKNAKFAFVYDEFGACQGIISLRDIFEGLIGVVTDNDDEPQIIARENNAGWLIDGQCPFYDFLVYFEREDETDDVDYNTVSGLILSRLGHIPTSGESITWRDFKFEVVDMDGARIDKVLVTK